eukprot:CAMPEP_0195531704 /NCGR_PEP_ID=MMETSP0794_2-20130614/36100_1 /TAXON_ID=515487 /ORGANISM="Stephanopyxis turris, Strain CCMP 815" /LENGTH=81 /DNA_ID=CAMNT_0040663603 /DNA_START=28 /DNA_END=270 /DNA_ORIENTATION=+
MKGLTAKRVGLIVERQAPKEVTIMLIPLISNNAWTIVPLIIIGATVGNTCMVVMDIGASFGKRIPRSLKLKAEFIALEGRT